MVKDILQRILLALYLLGLMALIAGIGVLAIWGSDILCRIGAALCGGAIVMTLGVMVISVIRYGDAFVLLDAYP